MGFCLVEIIVNVCVVVEVVVEVVEFLCECLSGSRGCCGVCVVERVFFWEFHVLCSYLFSGTYVWDLYICRSYLSGNMA